MIKIIGKRKPATGIHATNQLQKLVISLRGGKPFIPRGVYRFKSFDEAQKWSIEMMTRKKSC